MVIPVRLKDKTAGAGIPPTRAAKAVRVLNVEKKQREFKPLQDVPHGYCYQIMGTGFGSWVNSVGLIDYHLDIASVLCGPPSDQFLKSKK